MTPLAQILSTFRDSSMTEREKGTYFEELILAYLRHEASYRDLYSKVWTWAQWAPQHGFSAKDDGIDLVAEVADSGEFHAIQCKFYASGYKLQKKDIDSFFTASGRQPFAHRLIVSTTDRWSDNAEIALVGQQIPVSKITLHDLEASQIDWSQFQPNAPVVIKPKKTLRPHQESALRAARGGLAEADRGKLIMACGTGKTFTGLKIAEDQAGRGKRVLFLVPSLSLLSQTLTEWTQESTTPLHCFAVCSDSDVGKKKGKNDEDAVQTLIHELRFPATTDAKRLALTVEHRHDSQHMTVVFSTYHSIDVLHRAQHEFGMGDFDLVICDEAHRTTGATFDGDDESAFVRIHDAAYLRTAKRLYMTATPRIFGEAAKAKAEDGSVTLCSMDDESLFGKEFFVITFSEAVKRGLLVDYKVIVLAVEEGHISRSLQQMLKSDDNTLRVDDAAKIIGCWKALAKLGLEEAENGPVQPMKRAVAFAQVIEPGKAGKNAKVSSKQIAGMFQAVVEAYQDAEDIEDAARLTCEADHVDGSMSAGTKEAKIDWLKAETPPDTCRILSNVRCLSEGVDVPALDAVLFLTPRNSQVDVVQSVGRVMRNAPGKTRGYVVLPVVIPAGVEPEQALNDNQTYKVVWQVLQALRSHDDRFDAMVNKLDLTGPDRSKMEVIAIADNVQRRSVPAKVSKTDKDLQKARGKDRLGKAQGKHGPAPEQSEMVFDVGEVERALYAKIVDKCGNRTHWEDWAKDIARIANTHIDRIKLVLEDGNQPVARKAFDEFAAELRDDLNDKVSDEEIIEMLAQHLITRPVFEALFGDYSFAANNPMSKAMQAVLEILDAEHLEKETGSLQAFYESVKMRAEGINSAEGKQRIIVELYDKFFRSAFPKMTERLGIVYTPVEVVDFILHSVDHLLRKEFDQCLGSEGVHIIDPFTGTGTFITRLLQSGLISPEQLPYKYRNEIHANELVLLAYYIAAINIEATYHGVTGGEYVPYEGICLTDTFQMHEKGDMVDELLHHNSARRKRQLELDIRVIVGNPPYSVGQGSANDNNQNVEYPKLDFDIDNTFGIKSSAKLKKSLRDSYIRAIRWACNRIGDKGVVGFVTNAGWLDSSSADGMRKCLAADFSNIYVVNLRGNQRTSGETSRREGGKIFGGGSRAPISIVFLVKNKDSSSLGNIYYHDIGDYLTREQKLNLISEFGSIDGVRQWCMIEPNEHGDWLNKRAAGFENFIKIGDKSKESAGLFSIYSNGTKTNRDAWCLNSSKLKLSENMRRMISTYNEQIVRLNSIHPIADRKSRQEVIDSGNYERDPSLISWSGDLLGDLVKGKASKFDNARVVKATYRPFFKTWMYFDRQMNNSIYQMPKMFPGDLENKAIAVSGVGALNEFSAIMVDSVADLCVADMRVSQYFPLKIEENTPFEGELFKSAGCNDVMVKDAITGVAVNHFTVAYGDNTKISKDDIFYYVYALLQSVDYRERYADNLGKELPRIPRVRTAEDFWAFSKAGRALADLHLNYETVEPYPLTIKARGPLVDADYRVEKMKFAKKKDPESGKNINDRSTVIYNDKITLTDIPDRVWDYVVNGKAALDWVMERQAVRVDKASGIVNDANDWAIETMGNPRYPLELFQRVVTVSLETLKIVDSLPTLDIHPLDS